MTILGATSPPRFPIGISEYDKLREGGYTYVDKTHWVADVLGSSAEAILVPRPRRFGKTLNMSTLQAFAERVPDAEREARQKLFEDTWVWSADDGAWRAHFGRYPVIALSFKDIKEPTWEQCAAKLTRLLSRNLRQLDRRGQLDLEDTGDIDRVRQLSRDTTPIDAFSDMLVDVSLWCHRSTGERAIILIDEYDAPLHAAWQYGYLDDALPFFRGFLSGGLKDNAHLFKGVLTGILRVAKEGIFSGLNNLETSSILSDSFVDHFGFTETEVAQLAHLAERGDDLAQMQDWYNGYRFGARNVTTIYNPWSALRFFKEPGHGPRSFWKNTSDNALIRDLLRMHAANVGPGVEALLQGGTIEQIVDESVALPDLKRRPSTVVDLLLFSGYLTPTSARATDRGLLATLRIPNREVRSIFTDTFGEWLREAATRSGGSERVEALTTAMLSGDAAVFEDVLGELLVALLSYYDTGAPSVEAVYQAFIVGLLVHLEATHRVASNREAGYGRADVLVTPRATSGDETPRGAVLELKRVLSRESVDEALNAAAAQLVDRDYAAEVSAAGADEVHQYAVVFDGKRCWVRVV